MSTGTTPQNPASGNDPVFLVVEYNGRKVAIGRNPNYQVAALGATCLLPPYLMSQRNTRSKRPRTSEEQDSETPVFLVVEHDGRKVVIPRNPSYQATIASIKKNVRALKRTPDHQMVLIAHIEEVDDDARITEDVWASLFPKLVKVRVELDDELSELSDGCAGEDHQCPNPLPQPGSEIDSPSGCLGDRIPVGRRATQSSGMNIFAIYPPTAIKTPADGLGQTIAWTVDAQPDGMLWDQATRREVAYLFWEAHTNPKLLSSPPTTRPSSPVETLPHVFDPASPILTPRHSALLPFDKVTGYIDDVLLALGLHTEARTSFITYWLPDLSKHAFIALRFLPQEEYEKAAPLNITPMPEVATRVFMLFRGVEESQIELWNDAVEMGRMDASVWKDTVGIDATKVHDTSLFRVLEWGGMEVK
ncbi:unnamed protein product [Rhizoctonia solani]|uniref:Uncharacterized protein n=1 Tax=Rhizoctonia solani TaxID=456999 RepID=A0A8H3HX65_9AGAM|nr:unnamed protein product [Rhizoctonia solani]